MTAEGAAAEMRQALGMSVFSGMIGVTFFGLLFTPVFYVLTRKLALLRKKPQTKPTQPEARPSVQGEPS